jgi:hypothetical protein
MKQFLRRGSAEQCFPGIEVQWYLDASMWEEAVCSLDNCVVFPHTCLSGCMHTKRQCHEICFWHLPATAGAVVAHFVVVLESLRSHLLGEH